MSATVASSGAFWAGLLGALAVLYVAPTAIAVIGHAENIALVAILNCIPVPGRPRSSWPAWRRAKSSRPVYQRG
jgi:hypothetical protein